MVDQNATSISPLASSLHDFRGELRLLGQVPPMIAGYSTTLHAALRNEGTQTWITTGETPVLLTQNWFASDGSVVSRDTGRTPLGDPIHPGTRRNVEVVTMALPDAGSYRLQLTLRERRGPWFDARHFRSLLLPVSVEVLDEHARAKVVILSSPPVMEAGAEVSGIYVEVHNLGRWTWKAAGPYSVLVVHRWLTLNGKQIEKKSARNHLSGDVRPGQVIRERIRVRAPKTPGRFRLEITLMQDEVTWFTGSEQMSTDPVEVEIFDPLAGSFEIVSRLRKLGSEWSLNTQTRIYNDWHSTTQELSRSEAIVAANLAATWPRKLQVAVIIPEVSTGQEGRLGETLESLRTQIYDEIQVHVLISDRSPSAALTACISGHPVKVAIGPLVTPVDLLDTDVGEVVIIARCGDVFAPHALLFIVAEFLRNPEVQWVFWDSDEQGNAGQGREPRLLASFDPELARSTDWYIRSGAIAQSRPITVRHSATPSLLELSISRQLIQSILLVGAVHIPFVLQRRHEDMGSVSRQLMLTAATRDVCDPAPTCQKPLVSIIILNRDQPNLLKRCVASLVRLTVYPTYEIVIVDNGSTNEETLSFEADLERSGAATVIRDASPFSWSRLCNRATHLAQGEILCFLNNDVEIGTELWLNRLVAHVLQPAVGAVGATLWFGNNELQHGGIVLDTTALASHARKGWSRWESPPDPDSRTRTVSAVTGACLVTRRDTFETLSGFDEVYLPIGLSDVDYCLRARRELELRTVLSVDADLFHRESATRGKQVYPGSPEMAIRDRARRYLLNASYDNLASDPWSSPNRNSAGWLASGSTLRKVSLRSQLRRYAVPPRPKLAFVHVPKTAGVALRTRLAAEYSSRGVVAFSARSILQCYAGDRLAIAAARQVANNAEVLFSHFSVGFGDLIKVACVYATVLRHPVERVLSHFAHLQRSKFGPLVAAGLEDCSLEWAVRYGLVPGNLMTRMILGEQPEPASWEEMVASGQAAAANFAGFRLPRDVWLARSGEPSTWPEVPAQTDAGLLDQALATLDRCFAFVSTVDSLDRAVVALANRLDWQDASGIERRNEGPAALNVDARLRNLIIEHNQIDMALYEIVSKGLGYRIYEARIAPFFGAAQELTAEDTGNR